MVFSILIPNYNGADLLEEYLPSVLEAAHSAGEPFELIVVDDGSADRSVDLLKNEYPEVILHRNERNAGFGEAVNRGMALCRHNTVVLLNNDVRLEKDFFPPLLRHFKNGGIFAVVARGLITQEGIVKNESITRLEFRDGFLELIQPGLLNPAEKFDSVCTVAHACGGFSAFDRGKFLALGGFDSLFFPFYWEDVDICYRAWKRGWRTLYEPGSIAHHRCHATIEKESKREFIERLHIRNNLLFTWKNVTDGEMLREHAFALNRRLRHPSDAFKAGYYEAMKRIEDVLARRSSGGAKEALSDREVIGLSANRSEVG